MWINRIIKKGSLSVLSLLLLILLSVGFAGCGTPKNLPGSKGGEYLSSRLQLTVPVKGAVYTVNGNMKIHKGKCMQVSLLMPILRSEVARIEVTPDHILLLDRMGKRYFESSLSSVQHYFDRRMDYKTIEKTIYKLSRDKKKKVLTPESLGIPKLNKGKVEFYKFSTEPVTVRLTEIPSRYTRVELQQILALLMSL